MSFLVALRKHKVFQVAVGYLAVAWLLVQVTAQGHQHLLAIGRTRTGAGVGHAGLR